MTVDASPCAGDWRPDIVAICVPVRNEAALLPAMLDALARQAGDDRVVLCVLFDACTDASERIVAARAAGLPFAVATDRLDAGGDPDAGRARRAALALGQAAVHGHGEAAFLTTDADSVPAADWVAATLRALAVADMVAGRIVRDPTHVDPVQDRLEIYYDRLFALRRTLDPVPWEALRTHHCTGGASLAFRARAYEAVGGFRHRRSGEDAAIVDEAHRAGLRVRRDAAVRVETSSRRIGRAVGGLADHLRTLADGAPLDQIRVAHPDDAAWQYRGHAAARAAFGARDGKRSFGALERLVGVEARDIAEVARTSPNAEAFAMRLVPGNPGGERLVGLVDAERALDALVTSRHEQAA